MSKPNYQALTATAQALAEQSGLTLTQSNHATDTPLTGAPVIRLATPESAQGREPLRYLRGQADLAALSVKYHNATLHQSQRPADAKAASVYDALEQMRVELLGAAQYEGVQHNLAHRMAIHCEVQGYANISERADPPIADILALLLRERRNGQAPPAAIANLVNLWRPWAEREAAATLHALRDRLDDQPAFNATVMDLLQQLDMLPASDTAEPADAPEEDDAADHQAQPEAEERQDDTAASEAPPAAEPSPEEPEARQADTGEAFEQAPEQPREQAAHLPNRPGEADHFHSMDYRIFTARYDEVVDAQQLADNEELRYFRTLLDEQVKRHPTVHTRLASRLTRLLMAQRLNEWVYDQEDGLIDNARLSRVVIHPDITTVYKTEQEAPFRDTVVTLLIDNSGSMRGRPITLAALSVDILARTLERCGVKVEILGFTTRDWKGGKSRKAWEDAGKPASPGRLNDLRHIIYKSADTRLNIARRQLGLMLKDGILKENIDGEALWWAYSRLLKRPEQRRILMVISDGAPVDDATLSTNYSGYLDRHLRDMIRLIEYQSAVELLAIGIGHDVTRYYSQAVTINEIDQLGDVMLKEMTRLFAA